MCEDVRKTDFHLRSRPFRDYLWRKSISGFDGVRKERILYGNCVVFAVFIACSQELSNSIISSNLHANLCRIALKVSAPEGNVWNFPVFLPTPGTSILFTLIKLVFRLAFQDMGTLFHATRVMFCAVGFSDARNIREAAEESVSFFQSVLH
jgi:hypothetical protein